MQIPAQRPRCEVTARWSKTLTPSESSGTTGAGVGGGGRCAPHTGMGAPSPAPTEDPVGPPRSSRRSREGPTGLDCDETEVSALSR
jgi:hypothetical protein